MDSNLANIIIRPTTKADWSRIIRWFNDGDDGLNYSLDDFKIESDLNGVSMFVAENEKTNDLLGHIAVTRHNSLHSYVSLFHVRNEFKRLGVDDLLWNAAVGLTKTTNIIFDDNYGNNKYSVNGLADRYHLQSTPWQIQHFVGEPSDWQTLWKNPPHTDLHVCHAQMVRAEDLADFERQITNLHRVDWWREFITHSNKWIPECVSLIVTKDSSILGFGMIRPGHRRPQLGPLYALREDVARLLIRNLMGSSRKARDNGIELAVPSSNLEMIEFMHRLKLNLYQTVQRYFTKLRPNLKLGNIYAFSNSLVQYV